MRRTDKEDDSANQRWIPNGGSYAHPDMQKLLDITVESRDKNESSDEQSARKAPKKKVAFLVAFLGESYFGMQINVGRRTIQAEIDWALYKSGLISLANFGFPQKYSWSNAARTDRGVHAAAQVCSLKIAFPPSDDTDGVRERINAELPGDIRVLDVRRTTRNFCARTQRDKARYVYMTPSFMLKERDGLRRIFEEKGCTRNGREASDPLSDEEIRALRPAFREFRASAADVRRLREALKLFEGTHSFHNFTNGKTSSDPSSKRYVESFETLDPIVGEGGMEWITTVVVGQSFLLHQIRKMTSLAIDVARGAATTPDVIKDAMTERRMILGLAPAQGLFLDMSFFGQYNKIKRPDEPLSWATTETPAVKRWRKFKEERIIKHIMKEEERDGNFLKYLYRQEYHFDRERYFPLPVAEKED